MTTPNSSDPRQQIAALATDREVAEAAVRLLHARRERIAELKQDNQDLLDEIGQLKRELESRASAIFDQQAAELDEVRERLNNEQARAAVAEGALARVQEWLDDERRDNADLRQRVAKLERERWI